MSNDQLSGAEGGCGCGEVRYRLASTPLFVHCCHCTSCQRETGSAFAINILIEGDRVEILNGEPKPLLMPSESGTGQQIWRCPSCATAVWSNYGGTNDVVRFVRAGTLDERQFVVPDIHIYTRSKVPWVTIPEGSHVAAAYYNSREVWPAESLERRKLIFG